MHYNIRCYLPEAPQGDGDFFGFAVVVGDNGVKLYRMNEFFKAGNVFDTESLFLGCFLISYL